MRISHIVNVYYPKDPDALLAQQITLDSLLRARENLKHPIDVKILACKHVSDCFSVPSGVEFTEGLTRYAHDAHPGLLTLSCFLYSGDILARGVSKYDSDFYIYSNSDIGAYPNLYNKIFNLIEEGFDGACINRTTLPKENKGKSVCTDDYTDLLYKSPRIPHGGTDFSYSPTTVGSVCINWVLYLLATLL